MRPLLLCALAFPAAAQIVDVHASPYAKVHALPVSAVKLGAGFWTPRMRINVERSIPTLLELLESHGVVDNFRRLSGRKQVPRSGPLFTDSDLYKWMEAAAFVLQSERRPELESTLDRLAGDILAAQEPSGYLNTYYVEEREKLRFTEMQRSHELYCLGHLLQAGIAYYRATGKRKLLDGGAKFADYLCENFGPAKRPALTGHPELEMALVELYRTTGQRRYLDFAAYLLSGVERERLKLRDADIRYMFSGAPFTSRKIFEGHSVRAMYAACGAADYYLETGDAAYRATLETLWSDLTDRKMYLTGGVGSRSAGEAFGEPYELPNLQAYTESCAAIGNLMWNWRLFLAGGETRFLDVMERALYNGINSGMSLTGTLYCYRNPLESRGEKIRSEWYNTTCCPPNLERTLAALPGYMYAIGPRGVYVNFYHAGEASTKLAKISQRTDYPWSGAVEIAVEPAAPAEFSLFLRIPAWSRKAAVDGKPAPAGKWFEVRRLWKPGARVRLALDVAPRLTAAHPLTRENHAKLAVERGPLVYCLEQPDNGPVFGLALNLKAGFREERAEVLGGIVRLRHAGLSFPIGGPLYETFQPRPGKPAELTFIPYYAWANRDQGEMAVWIPYR
ncbi:MAG: glycoside hydrolase family 127 protein [Bryobacteraceae bacterium]